MCTDFLTTVSFVMLYYIQYNLQLFLKMNTQANNFNIRFERKSKSQLPDSFLPDKATDKIALIMFHCLEISEAG